MRHAREEKSSRRLHVERSDSTQFLMRNWWNIGETVVVEVGGQLVDNWWYVLEHEIGGILFFMVLIFFWSFHQFHQWWNWSNIGGKTVGQIRGARIEKHFVQHQVVILAPTRVVAVLSTQLCLIF